MQENHNSAGGRRRGLGRVRRRMTPVPSPPFLTGFKRSGSGDSAKASRFGFQGRRRLDFASIRRGKPRRLSTSQREKKRGQAKFFFFYPGEINHQSRSCPKGGFALEGGDTKVLYFPYRSSGKRYEVLIVGWWWHHAGWLDGWLALPVLSVSPFPDQGQQPAVTPYESRTTQKGKVDPNHPNPCE